MNEIFTALGIESWKPVASALLLPPVPLLVLVLIGARLMFHRRLLAWFLIVLSVVGLWLSCTTAASRGLTQWLLKPPAWLGDSQISELKKAQKTAIVVLGAGRRLRAPEYGVSSLKAMTMERLRYGLWLARETALPLAYSGGVGHGAAPGPSEAEIAVRIAEREFGRPLRWAEGESRDTRENGLKTIALLQPQGIERIVLVTHGFHMRRALRDFERAAEGTRIRIVAAPMGLSGGGPLSLADWVPSVDGFEGVWIALHEWIGYQVGA